MAHYLTSVGLFIRESLWQIFGRLGLELDQFLQRERAFSSRSVNVYRLGKEYALRAMTSDGVDTVGVGQMVRIPTCASSLAQKGDQATPRWARSGHELPQPRVQYAYIEEPKTAQTILSHPKSPTA